MLNSPSNSSQQEELIHDLEKWQKFFYDDVYSLFSRGDEERGKIAFDNWEGRFVKFLNKKLPSKIDDYASQTATRGAARLLGMTVLEYFNRRKGNSVRAFIEQMIEEAKKGYLEDEYIVDSPAEHEENQMKSASLKIFISHSSKDLQLVELIVDLLRSGLNLAAKDIRCTSLDGYRLPGGAQIDSQLRNEIMHATTLVGVISTVSFDSAYVLFELGARWGQGTYLIPLLAHGMTTASLRGPITQYNALRCDSEAQLYQFIIDVGKQIGVTPEDPPAIQRKIKAIVEYEKNSKWDTIG